jgi:hypothetical protein
MLINGEATKTCARDTDEVHKSTHITCDQATIQFMVMDPSMNDFNAADGSIDMAQLSSVEHCSLPYTHIVR